jgi:hypothetical protein
MDRHDYGIDVVESNEPAPNPQSGGDLPLRKSKQVKSVLIGVHCTPQLVERIEKFISTLEIEEMSRREAIRLILNRYFKQNGIE